MGNKFLPSITSALPNDVRQFLQRVREALTASGDKRLLTAGDLQNAGLAAVNPRTGDLEANVTESSGCSIPGAPTGLTVTGAMTTVLLEWDEPIDTDCISYTEVWRADVDDIGVAVLIGTARGQMYPDAVGSDYSAYYWIRHVNIDGNEGPYNATGGTVGETAPDPAYLREQLAGQIRESELYSSLGSRIDLIDGPETLDGSVNARVQSEQVAREDADSALASDITALQSTVNDPYTGVSANASAVDSLDTRVTTAEGDISANASAISTLQVDVDDNAAAIQTEQTARADADSAIASDVTTLQSKVYGNTVALQERAEVIDGLSAQYSVKIDNNGNVAGFGLSSETSEAGSTTSAFGVRADKFWLASSADSSTSSPDAGKVPFIVTTSDQTNNGVTMPAGTYIADAFIANGAISNAKIGLAAIDTAKIADASIVSAKIDNAAITNAKIASAAISSAQIQDAAILNAKIANAAITGAKIANATINTANIADAAITNAKVGSAAIGTANIDDAAITNAKIGLAAIDTANIANAAITNAKVGSAAIDTANIADAAISEAKIANAAITNAKVANGSISNAKIQNAAVDTAKIANLSVNGTKITGVVSGSFSVNDGGSTTINTVPGRNPLVAVFAGSDQTDIRVLVENGSFTIRNASSDSRWVVGTYVYI